MPCLALAPYMIPYSCPRGFHSSLAGQTPLLCGMLEQASLNHASIQGDREPRKHTGRQGTTGAAREASRETWEASRETREASMQASRETGNDASSLGDRDKSRGRYEQGEMAGGGTTLSMAEVGRSCTERWVGAGEEQLRIMRKQRRRRK